METPKPNYLEIAAQMRAIELPEELKILISAYCHESVNPSELAREILIYANLTSPVGTQKLIANVCAYIEIHVNLTENDPQELIDSLMIEIASQSIEKININDLSQEQRRKLINLIDKQNKPLN